MEWLDTTNLKSHMSSFIRLMHTITRMVRLFPVHPPPSNVYNICLHHAICHCECTFMVHVPTMYMYYYQQSDAISESLKNVPEPCTKPFVVCMKPSNIKVLQCQQWYISRAALHTMVKFATCYMVSFTLVTSPWIKYNIASFYPTFLYNLL